MRFTDRDRRLMLWVNGHGFGSVEQIAKWMNVSNAFAYARVKKLVDGGYLRRERILHNSKKIHMVTKLGKDACGDELPILNKVNFGTYLHDLKLIDLSLKLQKAHSAEFIPERRIRQLKGLSGVGTKGHIPDGILVISPEQKIAIELELTVKSRERLSKIMNEYASNLDFHEIWYYVEDEITRNALLKAAEKAGVFNIKIREVSNE